MTKKTLLGLLTVVCLSCTPLSATDAEPKPWAEIRDTARAFIEHETSDAAWPFAKQSWEDLHGKTKKVFAHFFVPFPPSFDNKAAGQDYYETYLSPEKSDAAMGKQSFYKKGSGGYIRQRPLPHGPWDSLYWMEINYAIQILRAQAIGLDGFAVDILQSAPGRPQYDRAALLLEVASHVAPGFSVLLMPDAAAAFRKMSAEKAAVSILSLADSPAAYRLDDGRLVIAPFYANKRPPEYWQEVLSRMQDAGTDTVLFPVFLYFGKLRQNAEAFASVAYGMSDWGFRDIDYAELCNFKKAPSLVAPYTEHWMMPVSPQDLRPKDLVLYEAQNTQLFRYLWEAALTTQTDYVQLITWDDYSESTEIAPSSKTQFLFYDLSAYYTQWFKVGAPPVILRDAIYFSHREHILPISDLDETLQRAHFKVEGRTPIQNNVEMLAMLTSPATLEIEQNNFIQSKDMTAGLVVFSVPAEVGIPIFRIVRDGKTVLETQSHWPISDSGPVENPIYCGGSSTRDFVDTETP